MFYQFDNICRLFDYKKFNFDLIQISYNLINLKYKTFKSIYFAIIS